MGGYKWTEEELNIIREHYPYKDVNELSYLLPKRSAAAIKLKAENLGVRKLDRSWYEEDDQLLIENYDHKTISELLDYFPNRTRSSLESRIHKLGLSKQGDKWTEEEDEALKQNFYNTSTSDMETLLPGRSTKAIRRRAAILDLKYKERTKFPRTFGTYKKNHNFFNEPNELNSYWAGFLAADGFVGKSERVVGCTLSQLDSDHLQQFVSDVEYEGPIYYHNNGVSDVCSVHIYDVPYWCYSLKEHFSITPRKTHTLERPNIPEHLSLPFIAGYLDGDGTIYVTNKNGRKYLALKLVGTQDMMEWIKEVLDKKFVFYKKRAPNVAPIKKSCVYVYSIKGRRAYDIVNYVNQLDLPILDRKWKKFYNESK